MTRWHTVLDALALPAAASGATLDPAEATISVFTSGSGRITETFTAQSGSLELDTAGSGSSTIARPGGVTVDLSAVAAGLAAGGAEPQAQASANASSSVSGGSSTAIGSSADVATSLKYQLRLDASAVSEDLVIGFVPVDIQIQSFVTASVDAPGVNSGVGSAARALVYLSDGDITIGSTGRVTPAFADRLIYSDFASASGLGPLEDTSDLTTDLTRSFLTGTTYTVVKTAQAEVTAANSGANSASGDAEAVVDPIFTVNQAAFDAEYGAQCLVVFGGACPDVSALFSFSYSEGVTQGVVSGPTPIPLPASMSLLAIGFAALGYLRRRARG